MALQKVDLKLYVYTGTSGVFSSQDLKYEITKDRISSRDNIVLEIGQLVKDYIVTSFNNDYVCNTTWVTAVVDYYDSITEAIYESNGTETFTYLAFDGYGDFQEEINPALSTDRESSTKLPAARPCQTWARSTARSSVKEPRRR